MTGPDRYRPCYENHPALAVGGGRVIYGGSCLTPFVTDADLYVGFDTGMGPSGAAQRILFEIIDMTPPQDAESFRALVANVSARLDRGEKVHVGCIGGHGRTGTFLAALVAYRRVSDDPIAYVRQHYCERAVETSEQAAFLARHFGCNA